MARPKKQGLDYFPLDTAFSRDEKIMAISAEYGIVGEHIVIHLFSTIYENYGYYLCWTKLARQKLYGNYRSYLTLDDIDRLIELMLEFELFDRAMFEEHGVLTSRAIQSRYFEAIGRRNVINEQFPYLLIDLYYREVLNRAGQVAYVYVDKNPVYVDKNPVNVDRNPVIVDRNPTKESEILKQNQNLKQTPKDKTTTTTTVACARSEAAASPVAPQQKQKQKQHRGELFSFDDLRQMCLSSEDWSERACEQWGIDRDMLDALLAYFNNDKMLRGTAEPKTLTAYQEHVMNYVSSRGLKGLMSNIKSQKDNAGPKRLAPTPRSVADSLPF